MNVTTVLNFVFFQLLWFSCVVGAGAYGLDWLALLALAPIIGLTLFTPWREMDAVLAAVALCGGLIIDNLWLQLDILSYPGQTFAPFWIALLWIGLGLTINHSMVWFRDRPWFGATAVGVFAPLSYLAGERFGAVVVESLTGTLAIAAVWFWAFYGLARLALWMRGDRAQALGDSSS